MKVFISWSGKRSKAVAVALQKWLPYIFPDLRTWLSSEDIGAGVRWGPALLKELDSSNFGVLCLTPENVNAPWVLFEAGAISKSMQGSCVIPYSFKLPANELEYPLAQFQGINADETGTRALLSSISHHGRYNLTDTRLDHVFAKWWPDLKSAFDAIAADVDDLPFLPSGIASPPLFARFHHSAITALRTKSAQLRDGYLQLFSQEIERIEAELFAYMAAGGLSSILCVDLTSNPTVLLTRTLRTKTREAFIRDGGSIKRILTVDQTKLQNRKYLDNLLQVIETDQRIGVQLGLRLFSSITGEFGQDFILYDGFCVVVEGRQADSAYHIGTSTVYFKQHSLDQYKHVFSSFWDGVGMRAPAPQLLNSFQDYLKQCPRTTRSIHLDYPRFKKEFLSVLA